MASRPLTYGTFRWCGRSEYRRAWPVPGTPKVPVRRDVLHNPKCSGHTLSGSLGEMPSGHPLRSADYQRSGRVTAFCLGPACGNGTPLPVCRLAGKVLGESAGPTGSSARAVRPLPAQLSAAGGTSQLPIPAEAPGQSSVVRTFTGVGTAILLPSAECAALIQTSAPSGREGTNPC